MDTTQFLGMLVVALGSLFGFFLGVGATVNKWRDGIDKKHHVIKRISKGTERRYAEDQGRPQGRDRACQSVP